MLAARSVDSAGQRNRNSHANVNTSLTKFLSTLLALPNCRFAVSEKEKAPARRQVLSLLVRDSEGLVVQDLAVYDADSLAVETGQLEAVEIVIVGG